MRRLVLPLLLAGALLPSTSASAADVTYRVIASGSGSYDLNIDLSSGGGTETSSVASSFGWRTVFPKVLFRNGRLAGPLTAPKAPKLTGTVQRRLVSRSPDAPDRAIDFGCSGSAPRDPQGVGGPEIDASRTRGVVVIRPFSGIEFATHRCDGFDPEPFGLFGDEQDPYGARNKDDRAFTAYFVVPRKLVGQGRIVELVSPQPTQLLPAACPGYSQAAGEQCTAKLRWTAQIRFERVACKASPPPKGRRSTARRSGCRR